MKFLLSLTFPNARRVRRRNTWDVELNRARRSSATVGLAGYAERL
ncbi:hypothetical protein [Nocardia sp. NPDC052112]